MPTNQIINNVLPWTQASAYNLQTVFDTNWTAAYASDVVVYQRGANEVPDELTQMLLESEYVVTFVGTAQVVRVTLLTPAPAGDIVTITRNTPVDRLNLYTNTNFVPSMLNQDTALLTLVDQERAMLNQQSVRYHLSGLNPKFAGTQNPPVVPLGPNQIWAMNPGGTAIIAYDVPEGGGIATDKATYLLQEPHIGLPNAQAMSELPTGFVVSNSGSGVQVTRVIEGIIHQTVVFNASGLVDNPSIGIADNAILPGTAGMGVPAGTTAQRVTPTGTNISLRFNTDLGQLEAYIGGQWVLVPSSAAGLFLPLAGGTMTGDILMDGHIIDGLPLPTGDDEAASKIYVDNVVGGASGGVTGNMQWNNGGAFAGDPNFNTDGAGNVEITGSLAVDNLLIDGNRISATSGLVELEDAQLFNAFDANNQRIQNVPLPSAGTDAVNRDYVDQTALNGTSVYAATTTNLTVTQSGSGAGATLTNAGSQAVFAIDGVSPPLNSLVLVKNLAAAANEGIYQVTNVGSVSTNWVLTRATSYDTPTEINNTGLIIVRNGTANQGTAWYNTATIVTVDTTNFNYVSFGLGLPVTVSNGGTGLTTLTAYALMAAGTTSTGNMQQVNTGSNGQLLQSKGNAALPDFTTATYPTSTTINRLLYSSANNTISEITTANNSVLITSAAGVPSLSSTLPAAVQANITAFGAATGTSVAFSNSATGGIVGTNTNNDASSGYVGQFLTATTTGAPGVSLTTATDTDVISISLPAGDWDAWGNVVCVGSGNNLTRAEAWISTSSATRPSTYQVNNINSTILNAISIGMNAPVLRVSLATTTTLYLSTYSAFASGTASAFGTINARRRR